MTGGVVVGYPVLQLPNLHVQVMCKDPAKAAQTAETVLNIWLDNKTWEVEFTTIQADAFLDLEKVRSERSAGRMSAVGHLGVLRERLVILQNQRESMLSPSHPAVGVAGRVRDIDSRISATEKDIKDAADDLQVISPAMADIDAKQAVIERSLKQAFHRSMSSLAQAYADRAMADWAAACPFPCLLVPHVLGENMVAPYVTAELDKIRAGVAGKEGDHAAP